MNIELAMEKGLLKEEVTNTYKYLENVYKYLFEVFLLSKVNLKIYDEQIKKSNYYFGKPNLSNINLSSGLTEYINLDYFCILNNFFIEKLDEDDLNILKNTLNIKKLEATTELLNMIERTYKDVIRNNYHQGKYKEEKYKVCYGVAIPSNFADNDALVLKMYYGRNTKELSDEEFIENLDNQKKFIDIISENIKKEIKQTLEINCEVLNEKVPN